MPAVALDLPGRSDGRNPGSVTLEECIGFVARSLPDDAVIVGHSISAEIAIAAATRAPRKVAAMIFVGGVVPYSGDSFMSLVPLPLRILLTVIFKWSKNGVTLPAAQIRKGYCNDLDEATTALVFEKITKEAPRIYLDPVEWSAMSVPRDYVKLLDDNSVKPKDQDEIIERIGANRVETMNSGHLPMLSKPEELAAIINRLAKRPGPHRL
jgi:pimeloyl-ACP methyl ester carboxylesterase